MGNLGYQDNIPWKWRLWMALIPIIAIAAGALVEYVQSQHRHEREVNQRLSMLTSQLDEGGFDRLRENLRAIAGMPFIVETAQGKLPPDNPETLAVVGSTALASDADLVYLLNDKGTTVACTPYVDGKTLTGENYGFRPYFLETMRTGKPSFYAALGVTTGRRGIYLSVPVFDDKQVVGVLASKVGLTGIEDSLRRHKTPMAILSPEGVVFATNREDWLYKTVLPISDTRREAIRATRQFGNEELSFTAMDFSQPRQEIDGKTRLLAEVPIIDTQWKLVGAFDPPVMNVASFALIAFVVWLVLVLISLGARLHLGLRASNRRFDQIAVHSGSFAWETDSDGLFTYVSHVAEQVIGYRPDELVGKFHFYDLHPVVGRETFRRTAIRAMQQKKSLTALENTIKARDGRTVWVSINALPLLNSKGAFLGYRGSSTDITSRKEAEAKLEATHQDLLQVSRRAGMSEVATGILHNVGNALNSVNVAASLATEKIRDSQISGLKRASKLVADHQDDLAEFITEHPQGKHLPAYLIEISKHLDREQTEVLDDLGTLRKNIEHIRQIVAMQQAHARGSGIAEKIAPRELFEDTLRIRAASFEQRNIEVVCDFEDVPPIQVERHKVMQILTNLVGNAKHAITDHRDSGGTITLGLRHVGEDRIRFEVADDGIGIADENLSRIFSFGFTTKQDGHGFGLHSSALAAKEMGGTLTVHSDGPGKGATFVLELPNSPIDELGAAEFEASEELQLSP